MAEMDRSTQQNAAMVEESSAAARMLAEESRKMAELVSHFNIAIPDVSVSDDLLARARYQTAMPGSLAA
jgi:methyl-accepting chemotaxis protein